MNRAEELLAVALLELWPRCSCGARAEYRPFESDCRHWRCAQCMERDKRASHRSPTELRMERAPGYEAVEELECEMRRARRATR